MIEFTTGVALLVSSVYGAGQAHTMVMNGAIGSTETDNRQVMAVQARFLDSKNIEKYLRAEFSDNPILVEVARCESAFRQYDENGSIIRGRVNKADVGIMQINEKYHAETALKLGYDIYSVEGNVAFGQYLYDKYGVEPWSASSKCWAGDLAVSK